ncbi:VTT domain-containing protein [Candidatus Micrarchaeota archaeon]|nr:VTT domain-containing protein [Candidatus Micrarchaeota archaeon]
MDKKPILSIGLVILISIIAFLLIEYLPFFESFGYMGAFVISLIGSATIIFPIPSWAVVFIMSKSYNPIILGIMAGLGGGIGELTGYYLGKGGTHLLNKEKKAKQYSEYVNKYGCLAVFVFSFLPNPVFDIIGITAGAMHMNIWKFLIAAILGKTFRFILLAYLGMYVLNY